MSNVTELREHAQLLLEALGWFLEDERFQVGVGGNPIVVDRMIDSARSIFENADAFLHPKKQPPPSGCDSLRGGI